MYGQGNFAPRFGQGPPASAPPSQPPHMSTTLPHSHKVEKNTAGQSDPPGYSQSYFVAPPQLLGSAPRVHHFSSAQQNPQWTPNVHHIPSQVLSPLAPPSTSGSGREMLPPPPPPRVIYPPYPQAQAPFRSQVQPPLPVGMQGLQHIPLLQPPQSSSTHFTNAPIGSVAHSVPQESHTATVALAPPPLPSSSPPGPPPLPPSSPPPTSPKACFKNTSTSLLPSSPLLDHSESCPNSSKHSEAELKNPNCNNKSSLPFPESVHFQNHGERTSSEPGYLLEHDSSSKQYQLDSLIDAGVTHSPSDSDMDMEDDITQVNDEHKIPVGLHEPQSVAGHISSQDCVSLGEGLSNEHKLSQNSGQSRSGRSLALVSSTNALGASVCTESNIIKLSTCSTEVLSQPFGSADAAGKNYVSGPVTGASAFSLIQDYSSDDSSESGSKLHREGQTPVSPLVKASAAHTHSETGVKLDVGSKGHSEAEMVGASSGNVVACSVSRSTMPLESSFELQRASEKPDIESTIKEVRLLETERGNLESGNSVITDKAVKQNAFDVGSVGAATESVKSLKGDKNSMPTQLKVDEFGRLVREGASDSDSDDLRYRRRHGKRNRSRSRSRSPHERRSLQRRREKRSRSPSWSPKKRRSRSRSPFWRGGEYVSDKSRRDKGQRPHCFDYQRGKCYRGASCRYLHNDSNRSEISRRYRNKYDEFPPIASDIGKTAGEHVELKRLESQHNQDLSGSSLSPPRDSNIYHKEVRVSGRNELKSQEMQISQDISGSSLGLHSSHNEVLPSAMNVSDETQGKREEVVESAIHIPENRTFQLVDSRSAPVVPDSDIGLLPPDNFFHGIESFEISANQQSKANPSDPVLQSAGIHPRHMDIASACDPSPLQSSINIHNPLDKSHLTQSYPPNSGRNLYSSQHFRVELNTDSLGQPPQLPPPPPPPSISYAVTAALPPQPNNYIMLPPIANHPAVPTAENHPSYQRPLFSHHTQFSGQTNFSWNSLPPPPPPPPYLSYVSGSTVHATSALHGVPSLQFPQNQLPPMASRSYLTELPTSSQFSEFNHGTYPPMQDSNQTLSRVDDLRSRMLPVSTSSQHYRDLQVREDSFMNLQGHGLISSISSAPSDAISQPAPLSKGPPAMRLQSFAGDNLNSGEQGKITLSMPSYTPNSLDRNQQSHVSDFGLSRIQPYYNPYASTFDQPVSSHITSNVSIQAKGMHHGNTCGDSSSLRHIQNDEQGPGSIGSNNKTRSPNSTQVAKKILPRSICEQYDPLFDSIELSSNSFKTSDNGQKREISDDSDNMLRLSGSNKPLDLVEKTKQREAGTVVLSSSPDNDEYGETAEAEVGAVENGSPSGPIDETNTGGIETDQVETRRENKKGKGSRSMKHFKVALADFVKEVLKPSWRQGNMSKEAFKTIVKKTVDKVSGAMKSHQVPKSEAKINRYIDSSQRKLTKLVMGYVDKYVKV